MNEILKELSHPRPDQPTDAYDPQVVGGLIESYFQLIDQVLLKSRNTPLEDDLLP